MQGKDNKQTSWSSYSWVAATVAAAAVAVYSWQYSQTVSTVRLHVGRGNFGKVLASCRALHSRYWPAPLAASAHAQTIVTVLRQATLLGSYSRQIVGLQDGGCVSLDWWRGGQSHLQHRASSTPIVLILHGLTGGSHEGYVKWMARAVAARGWRAVVLNYRGCAGVPLTSPKCYDAVSTGDVHAAVVYIQRNNPSAPLFAVGYSLGAILLTKYTADADSNRFASPPSPAAHSLPRQDASAQPQWPSSSPRLATPCASVASCATPATPASPVGREPPPGKGSPHSAAGHAVGGHGFADDYYWSEGGGAHGPQSITPGSRRGWHWQSCADLWPAPLLPATRAASGKDREALHSSAPPTPPYPEHWRPHTRGSGSVGRGHVSRHDGAQGSFSFAMHGAAVTGSGSGLAAAVAISSPFELVSASARLHRPWTMPWLYNRILTWRLKLYVRSHSRKISTLAPKVDLQAIYASATLREFDAAGTCKFLGFQSADEYYAHGSSENYIPSIRTPFLFLSSEDDPFLGDLQTSTKQVLANPSTALALTRAGGHCAHLMVRPALCTPRCFHQVSDHQRIEESFRLLDPTCTGPFVMLPFTADMALGGSARSVLLATGMVFAQGQCSSVLPGAALMRSCVQGLMPLAHSWTDGVTMDVFGAVLSSLPQSISRHAQSRESKPQY